MRIGQRIALAGMIVTALLAVLKILTGLAGHSTAVVADGLESAGDFFGSGIVLLGLTLAAKPADQDHPYGHGRLEIVSGLLTGLALSVGGALISALSIQRLGQPREPLAGYVVWPLFLSLAAKSALAGLKFHHGRKIKSTALTADAWHDAMDSISAIVALCAVGLTFRDPRRFLDADRYGGFVVGLIVISAGVRVAWDTTMQLMDTMPDEAMMGQIRAAAASVPRVRGVEKCFARKTGLRYHVDLHLEVDPEMTVRQSHEVAHQVRLRVMDTLDWVADVLVHVEPAP
ncbi:MAG: cation diffusion facilitator family transporter [Bryobacteraceae bacterium]